jgi:hypothetical protein
MLIVGLAPLRHGHAVRWWALTISLAFAAISLLRPTTLHPMNELWMKLSLLLSQVVTPILMGLVSVKICFMHISSLWV